MHEALRERFGDYFLTEEVATGAGGPIYRAWYLASEGEPEVVSLFRASAPLAEDAALAANLREEARRAATVHHPGIGVTISVGEFNGHSFFASEWINGLTSDRWALHPVLRETLSLADRAGLVARAARALSHVHRRGTTAGYPSGWLHRGVAPHRFILGYDGRLRLMGLGVAGALARSGVHSAPVANRAPEELVGADASAKTDLYALATVAWEWVVGRAFVSGQNDRETAANLLTVDPPRASWVQPALNESVDRAFRLALAKDPNDRALSLDEFAEAFETLGTGEELEERLADALRPLQEAADAALERERIEVVEYFRGGTENTVTMPVMEPAVEEPEAIADLEVVAEVEPHPELPPPQPLRPVHPTMEELAFRLDEVVPATPGGPNAAEDFQDSGGRPVVLLGALGTIVAFVLLVLFLR